MPTLFIILLIHFLIGFISDLILNYLSRQTYASKAIQSLKPYFMRKTIKSDYMRIFESAFNAGLTIVIAAIIVIVIFQLLFQIYHPRTLTELIYFLLIALPIGYSVDVFIYKTHIFGKEMDLYYKEVGAGIWGALAFIFSIIVSYFLIEVFKL